MGMDGPGRLLIDDAGHVIKVTQDGSDYKYEIIGKLRNAAGTIVNPATEETLTSIKDTAGVKKITDQLPAGTNEIGKVAQGTKAAGSGAWPQVLYDADGHAVGVVLDGSVYRIQSDAKIAKGASDLLHLDAIDTESGQGRLKTTLYSPDGDPIAFASVSADIKNDFAKHSGDSSLLVDGSGTPIEFTYDADTTYDISIQEIKFTLVSNSVTFGSGYFGATGGPLTNGVVVKVVIDSNETILYTLDQNESFVNFASPGGFQWVVSSKDLMSSAYVIGGGLKLNKNSSDKISILVQDDIDSCGVYFRCFVKGNLLTG